MHLHSEEDPPPDAPNFYSHVLCEHGGLNPSPSHRRKVSKEVVQHTVLMILVAVVLMNAGFRPRNSSPLYSLHGNRHLGAQRPAPFVR